MDKNIKKIKKIKKLWFQCPYTNEFYFKSLVKKNYMVIPNKYKCHLYNTSTDWLNFLCEEKSFIQEDINLLGKDPLNFQKNILYKTKLNINFNNNLYFNEAVLTGNAYVGKYNVQIAVMNFNFLGGSIGSVVGEKITRCIERAYVKKIPLIIITASGGARVHEGIYSLFQLSKINSSLQKLKLSGLLYISLLTNPSFAGAMASFSSIGDLIFAEPKTLIGFAGPRVIKSTISGELPKNFQTAEFLVNKGLIDQIVYRWDLKKCMLYFFNAFFNNFN